MGHIDFILLKVFSNIRALEWGECLMVIGDRFFCCLLCMKTYVGAPHLNRLIQTVQMRGRNFVSQ